MVYEGAPDGYMLDLDTDHHKSGSVTIISGRYRKDLRWGWECICGNDSRLSRQEAPDAKQLVVGGGQPAIDKLLESLAVTDDEKFSIVEA